MALTLGTIHWGAGARRILLLHGISSNAAGWWRVGPDLAADGWSVVAPDLRGHGTSPIGDDYTIAAYADDILALDGRWDVVLGHSLGGAVAVTAQALDPGWAGGLVLQDPALVTADADHDQVLAWLLEDFEGPATEDQIAAESPRWNPTDVRIKREALCQSSAAVVRATMEQNRPWNLIAEAAAVTVPTVVLGSDPAAGGVVPITIGEWLAGANPSIRYEMIDGAGHSAHREDDGYSSYLGALRSALAWIEEAGR